MTPARALTKSLNILNYRPMSRAALGERLQKAQAAPEVVLATLDKLEKMGLLNDRQLAEALVRAELLGKPTGARLLLFKLRRKKIPNDMAEAVVRQAVGSEAPEEAKAKAEEKAVAFAHSRLRGMARLEPLARKRRLYGALARRGLSPDVITKVLEAVKGEIGK